MLATITKIERDQKVVVYARVRRNYRDEGVSATQAALDAMRVGDQIEVKRVPNCPYLCLCGE